MNCISKWILLAVMICMGYTSNAQVDNQLWSSIRLRTSLNENTRLDFRPIVRHINDISDYQNSSIDITVNHKLVKGWYVQLTTRTWFTPGGPSRQFIWPEVGHSFTYKNIAISNRIRWHLALDLENNMDPDFMRWQTTIKPKVDWPIKPFLALEPWFRFNDADGFRRMRYEPGVNWSFAKNYNLTVMYRRQESLKTDPVSKQNQYVVTLTYKIK